jgi:hypothetical protein
MPTMQQLRCTAPEHQRTVSTQLPIQPEHPNLVPEHLRYVKHMHNIVDLCVTEP